MVEALQKVQLLPKEYSSTTRTTEVQVEVAEGEMNAKGRSDGSGVGEKRVGDDGGGAKAVIDPEPPEEPSLFDPRIGNPISHGQVMDLWKELKARDVTPKSLDALLRGARVYVPPPEPKVEPVWSDILSLRNIWLILYSDFRIQGTHGPPSP